jgi:N-acetylmuramoyl-L-alanine amidase
MMRKNKVIILDNGHGQETPGKRSPDGLFREYQWTRMFAQRLKYELEEWDYDVRIIVPEDTDIGLTARANRANKIVDQYGAGNCIFISIHCNAAASDGKWHNATGWSAWTTEGRTNSDKLAELLCEECEIEGIKLRTDKSDGDKDWEKNFTVIYKTKCPAVLTENMFQDSKADVEFLNSEEGIRKLLKLHVAGIRRYFEDVKGTHDGWISNNPDWDNYWIERYREPKCVMK